MSPRNERVCRVKDLLRSTSAASKDAFEVAVNDAPSPSASACDTCLHLLRLMSSETCVAQAPVRFCGLNKAHLNRSPAVHPCCPSFHSCLSSCMTSSSLAPTSCYGAPGCARCGGCMPLAGSTCRGRSCGAFCAQQVRISGACLGLLVGLHAHDDGLLQRAAGSTAAANARMAGVGPPHRQYTHRVMTV